MTKIVFYLLVISTLTLSCDSEKDCSLPERCELVPDSGMCKAYFPKYYYDKSEGKCKEFVWGGCGGVVPFETLEECKACTCGQTTSSE